MPHYFHIGVTYTTRSRVAARQLIDMREAADKGRTPKAPLGAPLPRTNITSVRSLGLYGKQSIDFKFQSRLGESRERSGKRGSISVTTIAAVTTDSNSAYTSANGFIGMLEAMLGFCYKGMDAPSIK